MRNWLRLHLNKFASDTLLLPTLMMFAHKRSAYIFVILIR